MCVGKKVQIPFGEFELFLLKNRQRKIFFIYIHFFIKGVTIKIENWQKLMHQHYHKIKDC